MAAFVAEEDTPDGRLFLPTMSTEETREEWSLPMSWATTAASASTTEPGEGEEGEGALDGVTWRLPGAVWVGLTMSQTDTDEDRLDLAEEEKKKTTTTTTTTNKKKNKMKKKEPLPRGLVVRTGWEVEAGQMRVLEREYDADGVLVEVRAKSAIRGSWVGGRM
jgi:hypothetical protein